MQASLINWSKHWFISGEHLYRRILQLTVALVLVIWIIQMWSSSERQSETVSRLHTDQMARVIIGQAAHEARIWLQDDNMRGLEGMADYLQRQDGVLEVSISDSFGKTLVRAGHDMPVHEFLNDLPTFMWAIPMVEQIEDTAGNRPLGFIRLTFDYNRIMAQNQIHQRAYYQQTGFMLFLAVLAGALAATAFLKRRPRRAPPLE